MKRLMLLGSIFVAPLNAAASGVDDKTVTCLPVAKAGWEAIVEVFDDVLSGKPQYEAAKADPSDTLLKMAEGMGSADDCAMMIGLYGPEGIKALMLKSSREDLDAGKYPRIFD